MATRFYLPSSGDAAVLPAIDAGWDVTGEADRRRCGTTKLGTDMATETRGETSPTTVAVLTRQYVSDPMNAQTIAGTIKGQIRAQRLNGVPKAEFAARVVSVDGLTVRGVLLPVGSGVGSQQIATEMKNRPFPRGWVDPGMAIAEVEAEAGDRIVFEIGWRAEDTSPNLRQCLFRFGDAASSDLPELEPNVTDDLNPWIELSTTVAFQAPGAGGGEAARAGQQYRSRRI